MRERGAIFVGCKVRVRESIGFRVGVRFSVRVNDSGSAIGFLFLMVDG